MKAALFLLLSVIGFSQSITMSVSPTTVAPGGMAVLTITFTDASPSLNLAGAEWALTLPTGVTAGNWTLGPPSATAGKVLNCAAACIDAGTGATLNDNAIASGTLATLPLTIASTIAGAQAITLVPTAVNVSGSAIPEANITATLTVATTPCKYCITGDTTASAADVAAALSQATGATPCTTGDVNGDGKCNVVDVELVLFAVPGIQ